MKTLIALSVFFSCTASFACYSPESAIEAYYGGFGEIVRTQYMGNGQYSISYFDSSRGVQCNEGVAEVKIDCSVEVVHELFCI